jgi:alanyl-tRNA synthetase
VIFKLYDTYGFPVDIVRDTIREEDITLDMEGFDREMADQRSRSRSKVSFAGISDAYRKLTSKGVQSEFLGHMQLQCESGVLLLVQDGSEVDFAGKGGNVEVVTEQTPFYGEAGGQVGDRGRITADDLDLEVTDTIKDPTGLIIHKGTVRSGRIQKGQTVQLSVDSEKRRATQRNHTATHILHAVLRGVLGDHVKQAGSLVAPDRMRFDFSHFSQIDPDTLDRIEALVNEKIRADMSMQTAEMEAEQAFQSGATALFEEKYGDRVRVVSLSDFSKELCGGTHVQRTGEIGLFKIVSESSAASGVRRIEALTGQAALEYAQETERLLQQAAHLVKDRPETVPARLEKLMADHKTLEKEVERLKAKIAVLSASGAEERIETVDGVKVLAKRVSVDTPAALRDLADQFKNKIGSGVVVLGAAAEGKAMLIAVVTKDLVDRFHAGNIVKDLAAVVGGKGGGRPDMAQAGGPQPENLEQALERVYEIVAGA